MTDAQPFALQVRQYGSATAHGALDDLFASCVQYQNLGAVVDEVIPNDVVQTCVSRLVNAIQLAPVGRPKEVANREWKCLCFLACKFCYSGAPQVLEMLAEIEVCRPMLAYCCGLVASSNDDQELMYCFKFLELFNQSVGGRAVVYNAVRCDMFAYLAERFGQASCETQLAALLQLVSSLFGLFVLPRGSNDVTELLRDGALCAIKCAALHVISLGATHDQMEFHRLNTAISSLGIILAVASRLPPEKHAVLHLETCQLSRNDMYRINVAIYWLIPLYRSNRKERLSIFATNYAAYIRLLWGAEALRSFLLYKPPREADAKPTALVLAEWVMEGGDASRESGVMRTLETLGHDIPELMDILSTLPPLPDRVGKDRHCAFPGCEVVGTGLYNNTKKCNRCKAVYYCGKYHQEDHWPQHRLTCVKAAEPVDDPEGTEG
jgi:hypothetical protein